jgi:hypothetical protein
MASPVRNDSSLTLDDLILRVAESAGLADYSGDIAAVPSSTHDYDLCRRAVNDGIEMIYRANPRWTFLFQMVSWVMDTAGAHPWAIDADPAKYRLPWYVQGQPDHACLTLQDTGNSAYQCPVVAMKIVQSARAAMGQDSGTPQIAAIDRLPGSLGNRSAWQVVFYPDPDQAYTVSGTFRCFAPKLIESAERHVMGVEHDQTVIAAGIYAKKMTDSKDAIEREHYRGIYDRALMESIELDKRMAPRTVGQVIDPSVCDVDSDVFDFGPRFITAAVNGVP